MRVETIVITGNTNAQLAWPIEFHMKSREVRCASYSASVAESPSPLTAPMTRSNHWLTSRAMKFCLLGGGLGAWPRTSPVTLGEDACELREAEDAARRWSLVRREVLARLGSRRAALGLVPAFAPSRRDWSVRPASLEELVRLEMELLEPDGLDCLSACLAPAILSDALSDARPLVLHESASRPSLESLPDLCRCVGDIRLSELPFHIPISYALAA